MDTKEGKKEVAEQRVAVIGIVIEDKKSVDNINMLLREYGEFIIGRMGLPYEKRGVHIISIVLDAQQDIISALCGKLGMLPDVSAKAIYSKLGKTTESS